MTIKLRLTLMFTGVLALLMATLMWALYLYASFQRSSEFTRQLFARALTAATVALERDEMTPDALAPFRNTLYSYQLDSESVAIFDQRNQAVFRSGVHPLTITSELRGRALAGRGLEVNDTGDVQSVYFPYEDNGGLYVVVVSAIDKAGLRSLETLGISLIAGFFAATTLMALAGWWFASRAMAPIADLMNRAERISAEDLHIRLHEGNGKDELAHLAQAFNRMLERLESAFRSQRAFIAHASHEIRTPLTTLEGEIEVALMRLRTELEYETILRNALDDTRRLRALSNDLLLLARTESEFFQRPTTIHQLDEILFNALQEIHQRYPERSVDVAFPASVETESAFRIRGNDDLLRVAIVNVIDNALKYSDAPSPVGVSFDASGGELRLTVEDHGRGIPAEELPEVFSPFFRGESTKDRPGTGVGLALVQRIVGHHGGRVTIGSRAGAGTIVTISLPGVLEASVVHPTLMSL